MIPLFLSGNTRRLLSVLLGASLLVFSGQLAAQPEQLTDNGYSERYPATGGGYVVWSGFDGEDAEILLYDLSSGQTRKLTQNEHHDVMPAVSADYVAWISLEGEESHVYLYDLQTDQTRRLTSRGARAAEPCISTRLVAWTDRAQGQGDIFIYDLELQQMRQLTRTAVAESRPQTAGPILGWQTASDAAGFTVKVVSLASDPPQTLIEGADGWNLSLTETHAAWQVENFGLVLYDLQHARRLGCPLQGEHPVLSGGKLVTHGGKFNSYDVFTYTLKTERDQQIANTGPSFYDMDYDAPYLVWRSFDGTDYEIFALNIQDSVESVPPLTGIQRYNLYPNPVVDELQIRFGTNAQAPEMVRLLDLDGQEVRTFRQFQHRTDASVSLPLGNYGPGIFLLEIEQGEVVERTRLLIK